MHEISLAPRLEAMRAVNSGEEPVLVIAAFGCAVAGCLHAMAAIFDLDVNVVVGPAFVEAFERTHNTLEGDGEDACTSGAGTAFPEPIGNA